MKAASPVVVYMYHHTFCRCRLKNHGVCRCCGFSPVQQSPQGTRTEGNCICKLIDQCSMDSQSQQTFSSLALAICEAAPWNNSGRSNCTLCDFRMLACWGPCLLWHAAVGPICITGWELSLSTGCFCQSCDELREAKHSGQPLSMFV